MSNLFGKIFRTKKGGKENVDPTEVARDTFYRRSLRSVGKPARKDRRVEYEDTMLPATAPYHVVTAPKTHRGPRSCPGGKLDDFNNSAMDRSFESNLYDVDRRSKKVHAREHDFKYGGKSAHETSEYGSQDPSPVGDFHHRASRSFHHVELDEDSDDDYGANEKIQQLEKTVHHYYDKIKRYEEKIMKQRADLKKLRQTLADREDAEKLYREQWKLEKSEKEKYKARVQQLQSEVRQYREMGVPQAHYNFAIPTQSHRLSFLPGMTSSYHHHPFHNQHTPTPSTSAMGGAVSGAGESLTNDVSFLTQGLNNSLLAPMQATARSAGLDHQTTPPSAFGAHPVLTQTPKFDANINVTLNTHPQRHLRDHDDEDDDEKDDVKVFRKADTEIETDLSMSALSANDLCLEASRAAPARSTTPVGDDDDDESISLHEHMQSACSTLTRESSDEKCTTSVDAKFENRILKRCELAKLSGSPMTASPLRRFHSTDL